LGEPRGIQRVGFRKKRGKGREEGGRRSEVGCTIDGLVSDWRTS